MKKVYLLGLLGLGAFCATAQNQKNQAVPAHSFPANTRKIEQTVDKAPVSPVRAESSPMNGPLRKADGLKNTKIGTSYNANQSNRAAYRRIIAYPDGKVSLTWMASQDNSDNGFFTRGSGYNHFNGTSWAKQDATANGLRIEGTTRAGFPCMILAPDGKEIILSHKVDTAGKSGGLLMSKNSGAGNTTWTTTPFMEPAAQEPSVLWPRAAVSGDYMIVVANYQDSTKDQPSQVVKNAVKAPLVYSRYKFSTGTWTETDLALPGYDTSYTFQGESDNYAIDANGAHVAIVVNTKFTSLAMWKSNDSGATWTKTIIDTFPVPYYNYDKDSLPRVTGGDGAVDVLIDANGKAHVFAGKCTIQDSVLGDNQYTFWRSSRIGSLNDGILYWNEYTGGYARQIANALPGADGDSVINDASFTNNDQSGYDISNSTWPATAVGTDGTIYLIYSALTPGDATTEPANYRDILVTWSTDSGTTWNTPVNITQYISINREEIFPMIARNVTDKLHITYLAKGLPGLASNAGDVFSIFHLSVPVARLTNGTVGIQAITNNEVFTINQNYPNPFSGTTTIPVNLTSAASVKVTVRNIVGQEVFVKDFGTLNTGLNNLEITPAVNTGVYFYDVEAAGYKVSGKMVIE